ncbi:hypothetical protein [Bremerella cremea]|uniref:hypothetical protein n=1 Tax=Bremerella cremea TaxID=1031537 RepID=UPI0031EF476A
METRAEYEANLNRLIGFVIERVTYFELDYQDGQSHFRDRADTGHFLDYGVELVDRSGRSVCVTWDATFFQYGLGVSIDVPGEKVLAGVAYDVTADPQWLPFIGSRVSSVASYWSWVGESMEADAKRTYYPQDIRLTFENQRSIYLSAAQFLGDSDKLYGMADNVLILFDEAVAQHHQIGPWAETSEW